MQGSRNRGGNLPFALVVALLLRLLAASVPLVVITPTFHLVAACFCFCRFFFKAHLRFFLAHFLRIPIDS